MMSSFLSKHTRPTQCVSVILPNNEIIYELDALGAPEHNPLLRDLHAYGVPVVSVEAGVGSTM
jgi:hypothetical protein